MTTTDRPCRANDPTWRFPCACNTCSRAAAAQWHQLMDRVHTNQITLTEAQRLAP